MSERLVIQDEVHGLIELQGSYKELVESKDFQRLKDIIQTGTSYLKYEDMKEETRFDHSVGSYYLMCKIIENIEEKLSMQGLKVNEEEEEIAKIAMLLHDIGHGAYSHTLEKITGYSHEKRGIDIIKDENTDIHKILAKNYGEEFANKVGAFLEKVYEHKKENRPNEEIRIVDNSVNLQDLLASLISNNIDADRLDYLVRDSQKAGYRVLTEVDKLIESFEFVLDVDKIIVAIPEENKRYADMAILERARNYEEIYLCNESVIGDNVFEFLLEELRKHPDEVPTQINETIRTFLTNQYAKIDTKEYMTITQTPVKEALETIKQTTNNEKIKALCDMEEMTTEYISLNTDKKEKYIRYLLKKAIPELKVNTKGLVEDIRWIKPYKSNENENINVITQNGIEDYGDIPQHLIKLDPFAKRVVAINPEMIRLELGVTKEEFEEKYAGTIEEIISTVTKPKDEFELRYVITKGRLDGASIKEKLEEKYQLVDEAKYASRDVYYDNPENYQFLENKEALRVREGTTFYKSKESYEFKKRRITHKKYGKDTKSNFTVRRKNEQIGETDSILDYSQFLEEMDIDQNTIQPTLTVDNLRYLYTISVNGAPVDISFNIANYKNEIYEMFGQIGTVEIKPKDNKVSDRLSLLELQQFIEQELPEIAKFSSNANVYEIGMLDTYEKYKKGFIISEDAQDYEEKHPESAKKIEEICNRAKRKEDFEWLNTIPTVEEVITKSAIQFEGEER